MQTVESLAHQVKDLKRRMDLVEAWLNQHVANSSLSHTRHPTLFTKSMSGAHSKAGAWYVAYQRINNNLGLLSAAGLTVTMSRVSASFSFAQLPGGYLIRPGPFPERAK